MFLSTIKIDAVALTWRRRMLRGLNAFGHSKGWVDDVFVCDE